MHSKSAYTIYGWRSMLEIIPYKIEEAQPRDQADIKLPQKLTVLGEID